MAMKKTKSARRRPKGDKRERTRAALLEAARAEVREKGYARTTLEAVARRAGMTTGAIYGNFKNRDELFIALGQTYWAPVRPKIKPDATFAEAMHALAKTKLAAVYDVTKSTYEFGAEWLPPFEPGQLPMKPEHLVCVLHALIEGLVMQRILTP